MLTFDQNEFKSKGRESTMIYSSSLIGQQREINLEDFEILSVLGKGTFGKVYLTKLKGDE